METNGDFNLLPEDCMVHILSLTTHRDVCVLSLVSATFRSASYSDALWEHFLPSDYASILSRSVHPVQCASKRELYFRLCDYPVLIDGGKLSFGLDKLTGAKCFTISATEMIFFEYNPQSGTAEFIQISGARFPVAVKLVHENWRGLQFFCCQFESRVLSLHITYAFHLIFRLPEVSLVDRNQPLTSKICVNKDDKYKRMGFFALKCERTVLLSRTYRSPLSKYRINRSPLSKYHIKRHIWSDEELQRSSMIVPKQRADGWMEVELGELYNESSDNKELHILLWKGRGYAISGFDILGIEIRPKGAAPPRLNFMKNM